MCCPDEDEDEGQHQHHLLSPGWTIEQVQITLDDAGHRRDEEGQDVSASSWVT